MKTTSVISIALLFSQVAAYSRHGIATDGPALAPAAAGPAAASLPALRLEFEIKNYNYYDLTKQTCTKKESAQGSKDSKASTKDKDKEPKKKDFKDPRIGVDEITSHADKMGDDIKGNFEKMKAESGGGTAPVLPWMQKKGQEKSLLETRESTFKCQTIMDVFRSAIEDVVRGLIQNVLAAGPAAPAPAPALAFGPASAPAHLVPLPPQPKSFLQSSRQGVPAPAPVMGPSPATVAPHAAIFVTFAPGRDLGGGRKSIIVKVTFTDTPNNGVDDLAVAKGIVQQAVGSGSFNKQVKQALYVATGIKPKLSKATVKKKTIEAWNVQKCEGHIRGIVGQFSKHYTREQVPMALYNECTNFMTKISFSNDHVLDPLDTVLCRKTTAKFAKHWNFGKNAKDDDFQLMCVRSCEAKFGKNAPQCNVQAGDGLLGQPL